MQSRERIPVVFGGRSGKGEEGSYRKRDVIRESFLVIYKE